MRWVALRAELRLQPGELLRHLGHEEEVALRVAHVGRLVGAQLAQHRRRARRVDERLQGAAAGVTHASQGRDTFVMLRLIR
eukprot:1194032-Prorocentrum_minimum.AAC.8